MIKYNKIFSVIILASLMLAIAFSLSVSPALAQGAADNLMWGGTEANVEAALGLGNEDPRTMVASVVNVAMGFLGIIAVVIVLLGGFKWMTAAGNEDKIEESKGLITSGVVGLIIILMSWAIAKFVIDLLYKQTGAEG
jgi:Zn-dependent protease with chaperone function